MTARAPPCPRGLGGYHTSVLIAGEEGEPLGGTNMAAGGCFGRPSSKPLLAAANEFASWGSVASIPPMGQRLNRALEKDASSIFQRCFYMVLYKQVVVHFQLVGVGWIWIWRELRF